MKKNSIMAITMSILLFSSISAQTDRSFNQSSIENLINAIQSDNEALKKSAIYFAGYYKLNETVPIMLEIFSNQNEKVKVLIALTRSRSTNKAIT